ncbi:MAG: hypothetical protein J0H87_07250 [Holosporales bacterium]|nr:hypothetical protein [Holosporales bacterium]
MVCCLLMSYPAAIHASNLEDLSTGSSGGHTGYPSNSGGSSDSDQSNDRDFSLPSKDQSNDRDFEYDSSNNSNSPKLA